MNFINKFNMIKGVVVVEIEGFFTERFINLCKINNIKIFDITNVTNGVIRFKLNINEFKKLKNIAKKTKCTVKIKKKQGLYFNLFRYRKRKILALLIVIVFALFFISNFFVWNINVNGYDKNIITSKLKEFDIHKGKLKISIDKNLIVKNLRSNLEDVSWVGVNIEGTSMNIKIVKKVEQSNKQNYEIGDIVATENGVISKIIAENGTAMYKEGSYVQKGDILIKGTIFSKVFGEENVPAKGMIRTRCEYVFEKNYFYNIVDKKIINSIRMTGISVNSKEFYINYLKKDKKYDKIKKSTNFKFLGLNISFDEYKFEEFAETDKTLSKEEILNIGNVESKEYIDNILKDIVEYNLIEEKVEELVIENGLTYIKKVIIDRPQGIFVVR